MPLRKLLKRQVEEIFRLYYFEGRDEYWLARIYDVSPETIRDIINRRTWKKLALKTPAEIRMDRMQNAEAYQALVDDGHSIFEVAMRTDKTPHDIFEELKWLKER